MAPRLSPAALLAVIQPWADVAEPIHRRLTQLAEAQSGQDVLWVGCGAGRSVLWWTERFGTHVEGTDPDPVAIDQADKAARATGFQRLATFQVTEATNLPHEEQVFDVVVVNFTSLGGGDGSKIMSEAGRVARPMATVMALVPTWLSSPEPADATLLEATGLTPQLLVEWKNYFRQAGIVELSVEEAAQDAGWIASGWVNLVARGWMAARWRGVRAVLSREFRTLRSLALRRVLGLSIIKGTRWPHST